jgi:hypothetical protein
LLAALATLRHLVRQSRYGHTRDSGDNTHLHRRHLIAIEYTVSATTPVTRPCSRRFGGTLWFPQFPELRQHQLPDCSARDSRI